MASNNIYLINKFSRGEQFQDYALFSEAPRVSSGYTKRLIYSNVFQSTTLARDEAWNLGISNSYYAWCGTTDTKLSPSTKVELSSSKLAALGTIPASGSAFTVAGVQGRPLLKSKITMTGDAGSFAIETANTFNGVVGVATVDENGSIRPLATMAASAGSIVNITPSRKFFIAARSASSGALLDTSIASRGAVAVDFAADAGRFAAVITHEEDGSFTVKYTSQETFTQAIVMASARTAAPPTSTQPDARDIELAALKQQIQKIQQELAAALKAAGVARQGSTTHNVPVTVTPPTPTPVATANTPAKKLEAFSAIESGAPVSAVTQDPYPVKASSTWYKATLPFRNAPGQSRRRDIRDRLSNYMQTQGYTYEGGAIDNTLTAMFSHSAGTYGEWHSIEQASQDWSDAAQSLPKHLKGFMVFADDFKVVRIPEAKGLWRARGETESRASSIPASPEIPTLAAYSTTPSQRSESPAKSSRSPIPASAPNKVLVNGNHGRNTSNSSTKSLTNGINGHHDRKSSGTKPLTNGVHVNGVKPVANGVNVRKYDYPKAQETAIEAAKRRARAVLQSEGLAEFASGWQVSGR